MIKKQENGLEEKIIANHHEIDLPFLHQKGIEVHTEKDFNCCATVVQF